MSNTHLSLLNNLNLIDFGKTAMTLSDEHQFILDYFNEKLPEDYKELNLKMKLINSS